MRLKVAVQRTVKSVQRLGTLKESLRAGVRIAMEHTQTSG